MSKSKISISVIVLAVCLALILLVASGCNTVQQHETCHENFNKKVDYLFEVQYNDYDWSNVNNWMNDENRAKPLAKACGCTSVRSGNFYGRSFDFCFTDMSEFLIRTPHTDSRYASIGMAISNCNITEDNILNKNGKCLSETDENLLPFTNVDGINENGVVINANVVPAKDLNANSDDGKYHTTGTNPGKENVFYQFVVRYVLDNAKSASHAVELLRNVNITSVNSNNQVVDYIGVGQMGYELHWMIADENDTYIVEVLDNQLYVLKNLNYAMTNSYNTCMTEGGCGLERYEICMSNLNTANTKDGMMSLVKKLQYSQAYNPEKLWTTEFTHVPINDNREITIFNIDELMATGQYNAAITEGLHQRAQIIANNDRSYGANAPWISTHAEVYDIASKSLSLMTQENYDRVFEYKLD